MKKDLLSLWDLEREEIYTLLEQAKSLKGKASISEKLKGLTLALIFEKASTRTKVSFAVAAHQLGAQVINLEQETSQLGRGESYADTARVLSQYVNGIVLRTYAQGNAIEMAQAATVPVINGLSDKHHPCQVLADLLTVEEEKGPLEKQIIAWVGDGNNMTHSWMVAAAKIGFTLKVATPKGREPDLEVVKKVQAENPKITLGHDPIEAVAGAAAVNTDTWQSMGQETTENLLPLFGPFQVNGELLKKADHDAIVLHCLPAHRGEEITDEVMDGPQSRIWQQAANRLPVQKAILLRYLVR